jgi:TldD protein
MLQRDELNLVLHRALSSGGDFSELFREDRMDTNIRCKERSLRGITSLHIHGCGIHVLKGTRAVYVHSNDSSLDGLLRLADRAAELLPSNPASPLAEIRFSHRVHPTPTPVRIWPRTVDFRRKIKVLREMDNAARDAAAGMSGGVRNLNLMYFDSSQRIFVANSEGLSTEDERVRTRVRMDTTVESGRESLFEFNDFVGPCGFELFEGDYEAFARVQVESMIARLRARPAESCVVPVVIEGGNGGVLWHEACGHTLEAESLATGYGEFAGRLGQKVASDKVTLIDDGGMPGMYGSEAVDDEGHPTRKNVLIEKGILKNYLCGRRGARLLGMESTGSGRRQSYCFAPTSRMHNTYLAAGEDDEEEMIRSMGDGLFVTELGGGDSGVEFSIAAREAYWVRNGSVSHQVKGINLSGNSMEMIQRVDRVGKRLVPEKGSFCGASSGLVPTTAFQPRIRISRMTVGGTRK